MSSNMLIVIGTLVLFSLLAVNSNRNVMLSQEKRIDSQLISTGTNLGQSYMNQISSKAFDAAVVNGGDLTDINILTNPNQLGPETGETLNTYNDIDDYNNYQNIITNTPGDTYTLIANINYVNESDFSSIVSTKTRVKRIYVYVTNSYMQDTVKIYYYKSY